MWQSGSFILLQVNKMTIVDFNDFNQEKECFYNGEHFSVRDNGAVFRHQRNGKPKRLNDNKWTFGQESSGNPYLHISNIRVHRIVATAFYGEPPDPKYVVDHIDSNCRNNRPENLRWLTRLENVLKNPATRKKIEYLCGSIEAFLENPSMLNDLQGDPHFAWMRTVTTEEAQNCRKRMSLWASIDQMSLKSTSAINYKSSLDKRVFGKLQKWEAGLRGEPGLDFALTPWCAQYMWGADVYFPCCPEPFGADPLEDYYRNLKLGSIFAYNDGNSFPQLTVFRSIIVKNKSSILVMCERSDHKWSIAGIILNDKLHFIHFYLGSYSKKDEAEKALSTKTELDGFWSDGYDKSWDVE
jgi:HNH endonuclease